MVPSGAVEGSKQEWDAQACEAKGVSWRLWDTGQSVLPAVRSDPITYMKFCLLSALVTPPRPVPVFLPIYPVSTSCSSPTN